MPQCARHGTKFYRSLCGRSGADSAAKPGPGAAMQIRFKGVVMSFAVASAALWLTTVPTAGQAPADKLFPAYKAPRTADGKPDLSGVWEALTSANWDILAHSAQPGPQPTLLGAWGAGRGGQSIVEGNEIPYQPW